MSDNDINELLKAFDNPHHCYPQDLVDAIRLLVKQRDEAMRLAMSVLDDDFIDEAGNIIIEQPRKEDAFSIAQREIYILRAAIAKSNAERDEARRKLAERAMDDLARLDAETRHME